MPNLFTCDLQQRKKVHLYCINNDKKRYQSPIQNLTNIQFHWHWKPPIQVSDWLICCCGNLMLYQKKKEMKMIKAQILWWKTAKKMSEKYMKVLRNIFLWTRHTDPWYNMLQTLERRIKYIGVILSDEHTPKHPW